MLEEQMEHQAFLSSQLPQDPVPYEARVHRQRSTQQQGPSPQSGPSGNERDTLTEFQEGFSKFAVCTP
jgi:hypothetical protein